MMGAAGENSVDDDATMETLALDDPPFLSHPFIPADSTSLLDPPSYADVVFAPAANGRPPSPSTRGSGGAGGGRYIRISVSDPQKEAESASSSLVPGGGTFVTYHVTTRTDSPDFCGGEVGPGISEFAVRRRFRDVVTLADRLAESYRGFFVPPRPDKSVVEAQVMQKQEFVEQRRAALERYLTRLAAHPVVGRSDELRVFLTASGRLPLPTTTDVASRMLDGAVKLPKQLFAGESAVVGVHEVVQPAKGGRDLLRIFKELRQSVSNDWGGAKPPLVEEDREFLEKKDKMQDLEQQLSNASQQATSAPIFLNL